MVFVHIHYNRYFGRSACGGVPAAYRPLADILRSLDRDLVRGAFAGEHFMEYFSRDCKDKTLLTFVKDCRR